jgi:hypothetical protein
MTDLRQRIVNAMLEANCREGGHADIYQLADAAMDVIHEDTEAEIKVLANRCIDATQRIIQRLERE